MKLIDFGMAIWQKQQDEIKSFSRGTISFWAPEIIKGHYNIEVDMWSAGVLAYFLLSGQYPFRKVSGCNRTEVLLKSILQCKLKFEGKTWVNISNEAKSFIAKLLEPNVEARLTPEQALTHEWFNLHMSYLAWLPFEHILRRD